MERLWRYSPSSGSPGDGVLRSSKCSLPDVASPLYFPLRGMLAHPRHCSSLNAFAATHPSGGSQDRGNLHQRSSVSLPGRRQNSPAAILGLGTEHRPARGGLPSRDAHLSRAQWYSHDNAEPVQTVCFQGQLEQTLPFVALQPVSHHSSSADRQWPGRGRRHI